MTAPAAGVVVTARRADVRIGKAEAGRILSALRGRSAADAYRALRFSPQLTSAPLTRVLEQALAEARRREIDVERLVLGAWEVTDGEEVRRLRRMAHGIADWIVTDTTAVTVELHEAAGSQPSAGGRPAHRRPPAQGAAGSRAAAWTDPRLHHAVELEPVFAALSSVIDPDLGINIVDLGFVRGISLQEGRLQLRLTLTNPFCPLTSVIADQVHTVLVGGGVVQDVAIDWVFQPPWTPADTSEEARAELTAIGISWR